MDFKIEDIKVKWKDGCEIKPLKILFETNEFNYEENDGNCEWTTLNNPDLRWEL